jgi:hypothetical protein
MRHPHARRLVLGVAQVRAGGGEAVEHVRVVLGVVLGGERLAGDDAEDLLVLVLGLVFGRVQAERDGEGLGVARGEHRGVHGGDRVERGLARAGEDRDLPA